MLESGELSRVGMFEGVGQETEQIGEFVIGFHTVYIQGLLGFADHCTLEDWRRN